MLQKIIFGLDISDHSIEAVVLSKPLLGRPAVRAYARTILRGEVVKNGVIKNQKKLQENIRQLLGSAQPRPITTPYCIVSLPESQVFTAVFKLPAGLTHKEIKNAIPFKAQEVIPFKSSEIYFDFKTITTEGETQEVLYVAVPTGIVDSYAVALRGMGLTPLALDLESNSLARAIVDQAKYKDGAALLIDIGARTTNLNIFDRSGIRQSLTINIAGDRFTKAIAKKLGLTPKEAAGYKEKFGFDAQKQQGKVLLVLQNEFKRILTETKSFIEYYQTEHHRPVKELILVGGSSLLPAVDQYLADNIGIETNRGNPLKKVADPRQLLKLKTKAIVFSNVIGLALRGLAKKPTSHDLNLLPLAFKRFSLAPSKADKRSWRLVYIRLVILGILLVGFAGLLMVRQRGADLYQLIFSPVDYEPSMSLDIDTLVLDRLRESALQPTITPTSTPALVEPKTVVAIAQTSVGFLNIRSGPGVNFAKVGEATAGQSYDFLEEQNDWYHITVDATLDGWVSSAFASLEEILVEPLPEETQASAPPDEETDASDLTSPEPDTFQIVVQETSVGYLNVRAESAVSSEKIGEVYPGDQITAFDEQNGWYQIELNTGQRGWVSSIYVDKLE